MSFSRFMIFATLTISSLAVVAGCSDFGNKDAFEFTPIYGDGSADGSEAVAQVGDIVITEKMLDLRFKELAPNLQVRYGGEEGRRLLLNMMVNETIMVLGAVEQELYNDPEVGMVLLAQRRITLDSAMRNVGLLKGKEPNDEDIRDYFLANKDKYRKEDSAKGRHVECLTYEVAMDAYDRLTEGGFANNWPHVVNELSINKETVKLVGEFGWFSKGSFLPMILNADAFTNAAIDLEFGLNKPIKIGNHWHVIDIIKKEFSRTMTFTEAREKVKMDMMASFQNAIIRDYLKNSREELNVVLKGSYAPGKGLSAAQLFERGMLIADDVEKIAMLSLVFEAYPDDERADDALYWAASAALNAYQDRGIGRRFLEILLEEYPNSEMIDQAQFLLENMDNPKVISPTSIEELRRNAK